jgi:hypothetical protein
MDFDQDSVAIYLIMRRSNQQQLARGVNLAWFAAEPTTAVDCTESVGNAVGMGPLEAGKNCGYDPEPHANKPSGQCVLQDGSFTTAFLLKSIAGKILRLQARWCLDSGPAII